MMTVMSRLMIAIFITNISTFLFEFCTWLMGTFWNINFFMNLHVSFYSRVLFAHFKQKQYMYYHIDVVESKVN